MTRIEGIHLHAPVYNVTTKIETFFGASTSIYFILRANAARLCLGNETCEDSLVGYYHPTITIDCMSRNTVVGSKESRSAKQSKGTLPDLSGMVGSAPRDSKV